MKTKFELGQKIWFIVSDDDYGNLCRECGGGVYESEQRVACGVVWKITLTESYDEVCVFYNVHNPENFDQDWGVVQEYAYATKKEAKKALKEVY